VSISKNHRTVNKIKALVDMNKVNPKALIHSKWTKTEVTNKEKHFVIVSVEFDEEQAVVACEIEAVINKEQYEINWRELKNSEKWKIGWQ
jgi:tryptophan-rich hypothetical protein